MTMDPERHVVADAAIAIRGDSIVAVGPRLEMLARFSPAERLDARGKLVLPGLIDGHNHAAMTLLRGLGDDKPLQEWLNDYIFPAEARNVDKDFVTLGTRLAALEMIRSGTTTFADMYYFEDAVAEVTRQAGMRGVLGEAIINFPAPDNKSPRGSARLYGDVPGRRQATRACCSRQPHSTYLLSEGPLRAAFALARSYHAPILIHPRRTNARLTTAALNMGSLRSGISTASGCSVRMSRRRIAWPSTPPISLCSRRMTSDASSIRRAI